MRALILIAVLLAACGPAGAVNDSPSLFAARHPHQTVIPTQDRGGGPVQAPPADLFRLVSYKAPVGDLAAYISKAPDDGVKRPAIIWMTGGNSNSIGDVWSPADPRNDQSARAFREAGIVTMYPSLRGGNENPGYREGFYGEVDDILAAADYLARQKGVDPKRIYLGGHSTGGTLVLLTAEYSARFRAVFAFGPVSDVSRYGGRFLPKGLTDPEEIKLRSPIHWLGSIAAPTYVFEADSHGNGSELVRLAQASQNPLAHFYLIHGADHFSTLAPTTALIAKKILADTGPQPSFAFSQAELDAPFGAAGAAP